MRLYLHGELDEAASDIETILETLSKSKGHVELEITSEGGYTYSAFALYNAIRKHGNVTTIANACCMSSALLVFAAGRYRISYPNTWFMIHEFNSSSSHDTVRARKLAEQQLREQTRYANLIADSSDKSVTHWIKMLNVETYFSEIQAKKWGLVQDIICIS